MTKVTTWIRKYIGSIISTLGIVLLAIITYGDMGELFTEKYWENVGGNITSIGALSIGLVMIQVTIKQGIAEQALSAGLNTPDTKKKYDEHKALLNINREKSIYLPYFLSMRNKRETKNRKREFLIDNNFTSERALIVSGNKRLIKKYNAIKTNITASSIKWSTTDIVYKKDGTIEKLDEYRKRRFRKGLISGIAFMVGTAFITGGMFLSAEQVSLWQKTIKFITYIFMIGITSLMDMGKSYEKGAFGVPNELDEVNNIWHEFELWQVPDWVLKEVEKNSQSNEYMALLDEDILKLPVPRDEEIQEIILEEDNDLVETTKEDIVSEGEYSINTRADV